VFCEWKIIYLFSLTLGLFYTKHLTDSDDYFLRKLRHVVIEPHVFDRMYMFSPRPSWRVSRDSTHAVQVNCILLNKGVYFLERSLNKPRYICFTQIILCLFYSHGNCRKQVAINNRNFMSNSIPSWNLSHGWSFLSAARLARFSLHTVCSVRTLSCLLVVSKAVLTTLCLLVFWWQKHNKI